MKKNVNNYSHYTEKTIGSGAVYLTRLKPSGYFTYHKLYSRVLYGAQNKQRLSSSTALNDWFFLTLWRRNFLLNFSTPVFKM